MMRSRIILTTSRGRVDELGLGVVTLRARGTIRRLVDVHGGALQLEVRQVQRLDDELRLRHLAAAPPPLATLPPPLALTSLHTRWSWR